MRNMITEVSAGSRSWLLVVSGDEEVNSLLLCAGAAVLGDADACDVLLAGDVVLVAVVGIVLVVAAVESVAAVAFVVVAGVVLVGAVVVVIVVGEAV
jgi:hypothetical protein